MNFKRGFKRVWLLLTVAYAVAAVGLAGWAFNELRAETLYRFDFMRNGKCYSVQAPDTGEAWRIAKTQVGEDVTVALNLSEEHRFCTLVNYSPFEPTERATFGRATGWAAAVLVGAFFAYLAACLIAVAVFRVSRWVIQGFREES